MKQSAKFKLALITGLICLMPMVAFAADQQGQGRPKGPPPEAIAACEGKSAGDSVEFTGRRGDTLKATCQEVEGQLVAVPDNAPQGR
ncbi:hypothetical protein DESUT3_33790 [Desulfuromonas versatilis]|uniref:Secreted protein n=1 Tax=Desulfuromonas versatilis TaxID=2802975 RepID=A0ABN6E1T4_9BACT|nr:hypothetical protein [Desulfuromonas versatilis]BCR06310.1 hypothetical protein DESUT3_33790 [Desulfuromonas versatilis]